MPGTTYSRSGPEQDPIGRLADFARFVEREAAEIDEAIEARPREAGRGSYAGMPIGTWSRLRIIVNTAEQIARDMSGYTTADDPTDEGREAPQ